MKGNFLNELQKRGVNIADTIISTEDPRANSYLQEYKKRKKQEEEIAPVGMVGTLASLKGNIAPVKDESDDGLDFFQKGAFSDGYQLGDVAKTILGTAGDIGLNVTKGVGGLVEGLTDVVQYGAAGISDLFGAYEAADKIRAGAKKNVVEDLTKGAGNYLDQYSVLGKTSDAIAQGLGQVGAIMLTGGLAAGAGLSATAATTGTMFASGMGSGISQAYQDGADDKEAYAFGAISGAADAITELIFGGMGKAVNAVGFSKGLSSADDMLAKKISSKISSQLGKNLAEFGVKASGEGVEEVLAGVLQAAGKKATYMSEKEVSDILEDENLLEQFVVGAATSGVMQSGLIKGTESGSLKESIKENKDFITGQTVNEQAVIKKEIEKRIAEQEKDGRKLTAREKSTIEAQVEADLDKGYISIDTIEETLGGDDYKAYKDTVDREDALMKEYDALMDLKESDLTVRQRKRLTDIEGMLEDIKGGTNRNPLKTKLSESVAEKAKADRLVESYNEKARKGTAFEADVTKYDAKQQAVIQKAIDSGILNNTNRTHDFVDFVAKISAEKGVLFDFTNNAKLKESGFAVDGKTVNGYVTKDGIAVNIQAAKSLNSVVGHEITHVLEGTEFYDVLQKSIIDYAKAKGDYQGRYDTLAKLYEGVEGANVDAELTADLVGDYLFTDTDFISRLSTENRNVFQKIYDEVKHLLKLATAGSKEARELERVKHLFEKAYRDAGKGASKSADTKLSLTIKHTDGTVEELADVRGLTDEQAVNYLKQAKSGKLQWNAYIPVRRDTPQVITDTLAGAGENVENLSLVMQVRKAQQAMSTESRGNRAGKHGNNVRKHAMTPEEVVEIVNNLDDPSMIILQTNRHNTNGASLPNTVAVFVEYNKNNKEGLAVIEFESSINPEFIGTEYGDTSYHTVVTVFEPDVERNGEPFDYAEELLSNPDNIELKIEKRQSAESAIGKKHPNTSSESPFSNNNIAQYGENVKYSLSDSEGRQLSKEQAEYFKDSKVRDADGNLKVMYHGTPNGDFTVFKDGTYFTDSREYADRYQNTNASSISSGKAATNPKTFEVYLDIKKPFDLNDAEARSIYINEYIKGGNAIGINPYLSDAEYDKIKTIDWTEGEDLRDFLTENGYDYDGLVLDEGADGGYGEDVKYRGTSYVIFSPEQAKAVDNTKPTGDPDIRFSLSEAVEETKDLMALHNLQSSELLKSLGLGGLPMPSIAVIKAEAGHDKYGDVSLILPKNVIDPKANKYNKVYGGDAWTPTYPSIEYKVNEKAQKAIEKKIDGLVPYDVQSGLGRVSLDYDNMSRDINRYDGDMYTAYRYNRAMKYAFLVDSGYSEQLPMTEKALDGSGRFKNDFIVEVVEKLGASEVEKLVNERIYDNEALISELRNMANENARAKYAGDSKVFKALFAKPLYTEQNFGFAQADSIIRAAHRYVVDGFEQTVDYKKATEVIDSAVDEAAYQEWINDLFSGIVEKEGIRNNADYFTPSGNRRKWEALHWENTLENVVKVMRGQEETGVGSLSPYNSFASLAQKKYGSIDEIKADSNRLSQIPEEEYEAMGNAFADRFAEIASSIKDPSERNRFIAMDEAAELIVDAVRTQKTSAGMLREMQKYNKRVTAQTVADIQTLISDIANMPTGYFEAKPQRAVSFDEVGVFVIPRNADVKLKQELLNKGYSIAEYDPNVEGDRSRVLNSFEEYKFSLSDVGEEHPVYGNYNVYGKDIALEGTPDIAPVRDSVQTPVQTPVQDILPDDYAPAVEETADMQSERLGSLTDADMPAEVETEYLEMADAVPLTQKVVKDIAKSVKGMLGLSNNQVGEVYSIVLDYSGREFPSREALFNEVAERFGQYTEKGVDEDLKAIKAELRNARVYVDDAIKNDITDYGQFKKRNFGKIRFSNEGLPVDVVYMELAENYPGYFPEDIINPSEQLQRMAEIANYDHNTEQVYELDDEMLLGVTDTIINAVNEFKASKRQAFAQKTARESFNALMPVADEYAPPMDDDIGPVTAPAAQTPVAQEVAPVDRQKELETMVGDKDSFFSNRAAKLYEEVTNLKKGVRASKALGYLLDYGYEWKSLKTALLNIRDNPGQRVNERSAIESIAREMINEEYEDKLYEMGELLDGAKSSKAVKSIRERLATKLLNHQTELANTKALRDQSNADYDSEIERLQAEYDAKPNKNTVAANNILLRIERMRRMKGNVDADYAKRISDLEGRVAKVSEEVRTGESKAEQGAMRRELHQNIMDRIKTRFAEKGFDFDSVLKKAKNLSTFSTVDNTPQRVMEKSLGYKEGQVLSDLTVDQVARNETEGIKWLNKYTDKKNGLLKKISEQYNIKPGSKESAAAQMYAEGFYVAENEDIIEYGDKELAKDFPDARVQANIKGLAKDPRVRQIYDETLALINASRARNAYPEIQKLDNYFLHFRAMSDTFSRLGLPFNPNDIKAKDLPTDLNGVTADLKPGQPYFASAMHRKGQRTSFDLLGGLEQYLTSAKGQIYHIDDIQTLRALRNYIADTFGQAKGLEGLDTLTEEEVQERIKEVYGAHLSTFAKFLNEEANTIAGKTALIDRGLEGIIGRRGITFLDTVNRQVGANMVGYNVSSSMTNFLAPVQAFAKTNKADFVKAFSQTVYNKLASINGKGDGFTEQSPVMIRRKGADRFHRTFWQKLSDPGYALMGAVDSFSTELIARAKYNEFTRKGMDAAQAHIEADKWTSRLMGDRSLGQQPHLYNSKMLGIVTKFQLEVRNQLDSQFYDTIQEAKVSNEDIQNAQVRNAKTAAKVASTFFSLAVGQHLFGKAFESIAGYNPAFDIIEALVKAFGWDDDEEDEDTVLDNLGQGFMSLMEDMPYSSVLTGGRIPIQSALPISEFFKGKDQYGNEKSRLETLSEAAPYYLLPGGYGQIKKTVAGLDMFSDEHPVAGSYTDSGNLRYPVEDTFLNRAQAAIFGQHANANARDYFDNERQSLKKNQIQEFVDVDIPIQDYWEYRDGLKKQETLEDKFDYIAGLDLPISKKNILINNVVDRKDPVDLSDYDAYSSYEEFDFATKNPEKYAFFEEVGISYSAYKNGDDDTKDAYDWAYNNPDKYLLSKAAASDVVEYRRYAKDLYDIKADKDENGKTISGSRKEKVIQYLNNLDIDYGERLILFKSEYEADDTYNADIVEYLNGRDDISFEEEVTILKELGFIVLPDGTVQW